MDTELTVSLALAGMYSSVMLLVCGWYVQTFLSQRFTKRHLLNLIIIAASIFVFPLHAVAYMGPQSGTDYAIVTTVLYMLLFASTTSLILTIKDSGQVILEGTKFAQVLPAMIKSMYVLFVPYIVIQCLGKLMTDGVNILGGISLTLAVILLVLFLAVYTAYAVLFYNFVRKRDNKLSAAYLKIAQYSLLMCSMNLPQCIMLGLLVILPEGSVAVVVATNVYSALLFANTLTFAAMQHHVHKLFSQQNTAEKSRQLSTALQTGTQTQTTTTQQTAVDLQSRVIAIPAHKLCYAEQFEVNAEHLGEGAGGKVQVANVADAILRDLFKCDTVAIKQVRFDEDFGREPFHQELAIISSLQSHPAIVKLFGYIEDNMQAALILKCYAGSLSQLIKSDLPLHCADIVRQITSALVEVHRCGIVHCDVKPSNFLYEYDAENRLLVCLTDFGVSQVRLGSEKVDARQNVRMPALSFPYAAPELLQLVRGGIFFVAKSTTAVILNQDQSLTEVGIAMPSIDIYSLAMIMWELVTRQKVWRHMKPDDIYNAVIVDGSRPDVLTPQWNDKLLEVYAHLMQQCWQQNPQARPTALQVYDQIQ